MKLGLFQKWRVILENNVTTSNNMPNSAAPLSAIRELSTGLEPTSHVRKILWVLNVAHANESTMIQRRYNLSSRPAMRWLKEDYDP